MKKPQIAKIINSKKLVINVGSDDGITEGEEFEIIDKVSDSDVKDPATGESLGNLTTSKGKVIVTRVFPRMSIVESPIERMNGLPAIGFVYRKDLNVDPEQITGGLPQSTNSAIQVGDYLQRV